jgi:diguanylate cyclase (GGDEF)-like protein
VNYVASGLDQPAYYVSMLGLKMDPSPELIGSVAAATQYRDRDDIERSLVELVAQFLDADIVSLYKLQRGAETDLVVSCVAAIGGAGGTRVTRGTSETLELAELVSWRRCLEKRAPRATLLTPGRFETVVPVIGGDDQPLGLLRIVRATAPDSRELNLVTGILKIISNHLALLEYGERDSLTGLLNRKTFDSQFEKLRAGLARRTAANPDHASWLAMVDIDRFKAVNDRHGHMLGDQVLAMASEVIQHSLRGTDHVYRFGGEEFAVLLPDVPQHVAVRAFERLRRAVEQHVFPQVGKVTVSLGWTQIRGNDSVTHALDRADRGLYHAKDNGRNQCCHYDAVLATGMYQRPPGLKDS